MIHGTQTIIIHDKKMLIGRRSKIKKLAPGRWNFIGGKIEDFDKNEKESAKREIKEETNLDVDLLYLSLRGKKIVSWDNGEEFLCNTFTYLIDDISALKLNVEHDEFKWISLEEFNNYNVIGYNFEEIKFLLKNYC